LSGIENLAEHKIQYVGYGVETCPDTKKVNHNMVVCAHRCQAQFQGVEEGFCISRTEKMHFERMQGNFAQNSKYIEKEGNLVEIGEKPMGNGKKRNLLDFKKQIEDGKAVLDIASENDNLIAR